MATEPLFIDNQSGKLYAANPAGILVQVAFGQGPTAINVTPQTTSGIPLNLGPAGTGSVIVSALSGSPSAPASKIVFPTGTVAFSGSVATYTPAGGGGLTPIANNTLLANTSGGTAVAISTTVSALLDAALGSTQGQLVTRNAGGWTVLGPSTGGKVLTENGAAANLSYLAPAVSSLTVAGVGPATLASGVLNIPTPPTTPVTVLQYTPNQIRCYGVRLLNIAYGGALFQVMNSGGTTKDIYPISGGIDADWAAVTTFAAGGTLGVSIWYDQGAGSSQHLTQGTFASQPLICVSGVLVSFPGTIAARYALQFSSARFLTGPSTSMPAPYGRYSVVQFTGNTSGTNIISDSSGSSLNWAATGSLASYGGSANITFKTGVAVNDIATVAEVINGALSHWGYNGTQGNYASNPGSSPSLNGSLGQSSFLCPEYICFGHFGPTYEVLFIQANQKVYYGTP